VTDAPNAAKPIQETTEAPERPIPQGPHWEGLTKMPCRRAA